jgi:predicted RecB family nuclease
LNNENRKIGLSKTSLLKGIQCPKALYLSKNRPAFEIPSDPDLEAKFEVGRDVGILAQQLFPGGTEVPFMGLTIAEQVAKTRELIEAGAQVLYEASFAFDGIFIKADILVRNGSTWEINEIKMSTSVKDPNSDDAAIQYFVVTNCGLSVSKISIVHINNKYERQGEIDVKQLFTSEDITELALARQNDLPGIVSDLRETLKGDEPDIDIGRYCSEPYPCEFIPYCWQHIPEDSVFSLKGRGINKFNYYY